MELPSCSATQHKKQFDILVFTITKCSYVILGGYWQMAKMEEIRINQLKRKFGETTAPPHRQPNNAQKETQKGHSLTHQLYEH